MNLASLPLRALLIYCYLLIVVRLAGKRTLRQTSALDLLVALIISALGASFALGEMAAATAVAGTGTFLALHVGMYYAAYRSSKVARWLGLGAAAPKEEAPEAQERRTSVG